VKAGSKSPAIDPSQPLRNPRHEAFVRLQAAGTGSTRAYASVYRTKWQAAGANGTKLRARPDVMARLRYLQSETAQAAVMDLREMLEFLTRVKRIPIGRLDARSELLRRFVIRPQGKRVWMLDKRACVALAAKLQGFGKRHAPGGHQEPATPAVPHPVAGKGALPLRNARHEAFARLRAAGQNKKQAYSVVYARRRDPKIGGWRVSQRPDVAARVDYLRSQAVTAAVIDRREVLEFLTQVMRTPIGEIDENSEMAQGVTISRNVKQIWMPRKLPCIKLLVKLQGLGWKEHQAAQARSQAAPPAGKVLTEERRAELIAAKRRAVERDLAAGRQGDGPYPVSRLR